MELHIISPLQTVIHEIAWVELNSNTGNIVIQSNHEPMLLVLAPNKEMIFRLKTGKEESLTIRAGIAEITRERTTVIINESI
jgi:F0F1-type ATP synthase epsilon subunit